MMNSVFNLENVAVFFGLLSVWYSKKEHILVYPTGIVNVLISTFLMYQAKLYADMGVNVYYFVMSIWGWYLWLKKNPKTSKKLPISNNSARENILSLGLVVLIFGILLVVLNRFTDSNTVEADDFTSACFVVGMYLMARKKTENWIYWIVGDVLIMPLMVYKNLYGLAFQYFIFTLLAVWGLVEWQKKSKPQHT